MLPDQIGMKASQRGKESVFSFLSQCALGILKFLSQGINTHIIAYGIFTHTAKAFYVPDMHMRLLSPQDA
eukprot:1721433-Ditylum_brightwellii.AAC.1